MPERTFYRRWGRLKKERERARKGGSVLEMLGREMVARDIIKAGLTEGWGDDAIIRAVTSETTLPAAQAKMLLRLSKGAPAEEQLALLNGARGLTDE